jgi:hypothetical protein
MKIVFRTLIILVAALVVVGIAGALNSAGTFDNLGPIGREGFGDGREFNGQPPTLPDGTRPNLEQGGGFQRGGFGRGGSNREGRGGANVFGLAEIGKNLLIMTVITIVIVSVSKLIKRLGRRTSALRAPSNQPD